MAGARFWVTHSPLKTTPFAGKTEDQRAYPNSLFWFARRLAITRGIDEGHQIRLNRRMDAPFTMNSSFDAMPSVPCVATDLVSGKSHVVKMARWPWRCVRRCRSRSVIASSRRKGGLCGRRPFLDKLPTDCGARWSAEIVIACTESASATQKHPSRYSAF